MQNALASLDAKVKNNLMKIQQEYLSRNLSIAELFKKFDAEKSERTLSLQGFQLLLKEFDQNLSFKEQTQLFEQFDADRSGKITVEEFSMQIFNSNFAEFSQNKVLFEMRAQKIIKQLKGLVQNAQMDVKQMFQRFDQDHNDSLSLEEFRGMCQQINEELSEQEARQVFLYFDTDESGTISFNEFFQVLFLFRKSRATSRSPRRVSSSTVSTRNSRSPSST